MGKRCAGFLWVLAACMLFGCSNAGSDDTATKSEAFSDEKTIKLDFPKTYQKVDGKVKFNCNIVAGNDVNSLYVAKAKKKSVEWNNVYSALWSDGDNGKVEDEVDENGAKEYNRTLGDKHLSFNENTTFISFGTGYYYKYDFVNSYNDEEAISGYNRDVFQKSKDFSFASGQEAFTKVEDELKKCGLDEKLDYSYCALDHNVLAANEESVPYEDSDKKYQPWSNDADCYQLYIRQLYQGLPVYYMNGMASDKNIAGDEYNAIKAMVSQNGVEDLYVGCIFNFEDEKQVTSVASFDEVINRISKKYNKIIGDGSIEINEIKLFYYVENYAYNKDDFKIKPCWVARGKDTVDGRYTETVIDAQTGKEIVICSQF